MSFRILVGIYCHNIPTYTPQSGVTEVAKAGNIAKMAEKCINCISARPTVPHTKAMESGPGNTFSAQNRKKPKGGSKNSLGDAFIGQNNDFPRS